MKNLSTVVIAMILVILIAVGGYFFLKSGQNGVSAQVVCTQEVKQCPDGSYVSRTGPNCEFTQCSQASTTPVNTQATITKTYSDAKQGVSFDYLDNFYMNGNLTNYIHPVEWPPQISVSSSTLKCAKVESKNINGKNYCVTTQSEGAAGSTYTTYTYRLYVNKKTVALSFIERMPQCGNYDEPKSTECKNEETNFDIDAMVDKIFDSLKWQ